MNSTEKPAPHEFDLSMYGGVRMVLEFMQTHLEASERRGVARAVAALAPAVWSECPDRPVRPLELLARLR